MKQYFKTIFFFIGTLLFVTFTIMFTINAIEIIHLGDPFSTAYYIVYIICLTFVTVLFTIKGIEHLFNDTPLRDKLTARKEAKKQVKAERAEAEKQARIEKLQNELEELKGDGE